MYAFRECMPAKQLSQGIIKNATTAITKIKRLEQGNNVDQYKLHCVYVLYSTE